jgi:RecQ family ATP-dependent DNA helicase
MYAGFTYANVRREEARAFGATVSSYSVPMEVLTTQVNKCGQRTFKEGLDRLMGKTPFSSVTVLRELRQNVPPPTFAQRPPSKNPQEPSSHLHANQGSCWNERPGHRQGPPTTSAPGTTHNSNQAVPEEDDFLEILDVDELVSEHYKKREQHDNAPPKKNIDRIQPPPRYETSHSHHQVANSHAGARGMEPQVQLSFPPNHSGVGGGTKDTKDLYIERLEMLVHLLQTNASDRKVPEITRECEALKARLGQESTQNPPRQALYNNDNVRNAERFEFFFEPGTTTTSNQLGARAEAPSSSAYTGQLVHNHNNSNGTGMGYENQDPPFFHSDHQGQGQGSIYPDDGFGGHSNMPGGGGFDMMAGAAGDEEMYVPQKPDIPKVTGYINAALIDGTMDPKWKRHDFPWSSELMMHNHHYFGYLKFRKDQEEIMNATLSRKDVFALMPTGGGKSLCYQLPALCEEGLTVVVSPLVALIQDQIAQLNEAKIDCGALGSSTDEFERRRILSSLRQSPPGIKLLYVTPEKVANSAHLLSVFDDLHKKSMLSRFVIDEAHCVSQWGHDFRKDYKELRVFKMKYPDVPALVLTATATAQVQEDIVQQLRIKSCIQFKSGFNRTNLSYEVRKKTKSCIQDMKKFILEKCVDRKTGRIQTGIIYCFSKFDCEKVSADLSAAFADHDCGRCYSCKNGMRNRCRTFKKVAVSFYHAGLEPEVRERVQSAWSNDEVQILCATVAFGMGINKPDVRFVIHYSLPKSLEGYHQEAGRAGRDLKDSHCVLFYRYGDYQKLKRLLEMSAKENNAPPQQLQNNIESLNGIVSYCENTIECRRVLLLRHFGEIFDPGLCHGTCDNCRDNLKSGKTYVSQDVTQDVLNIMSIIQETGQKHCMTHIVDVFRGSNCAKVRYNNHNKVSAFGKGSAWLKNESSRLLQKLVIDGILTEITSKADNQYQTVTTILRVNRKAEAEIKSNRKKIHLDVVAKIAKAKAPVKTKKVPLASINQWPCDQSQGNDQQHDDCVQEIESELRALRDSIIQKGKTAGIKLRNYHIFNNDLMRSIAVLMPRSMEDLHGLDGWSKNKVEKYGREVTQVVCRVLQKYGGMRPKANNNNNNSHAATAAKRKGNFSSNNSNSNKPQWQNKRQSFDSYSYEN